MKQQKIEPPPNPIVVELKKQRGLQIGCGTADLKESDLWCEALTKGVGNRFQNGLKILDWGCGYGRYYIWMKNKLKNFKYYGFEVASPKHGDILIQYCRDRFNKDKRCIFDFTTNHVLVNKAIENSDVVLLGSVFTHLTIEDSYKIMTKFRPVIQKGGYIVLSVILSLEYTLTTPNFYPGNPRSWAYVTNTEKQVKQLAKMAGGKAQKIPEAQFTAKHILDIFRVEK
jgi:2-polyprenyl-3-methyl-5-hydroxy-6-metoxy-1,4-benzoquinol methylase